MRSRCRNAGRSCFVISRINNSCRHDISRTERECFKLALEYSDLIIFISDFCRASWISEFESLDIGSKSEVFYNFGDDSIFFPKIRQSDDRQGKKIVVTHHVSTNPLKGHDIYRKVDALLNGPLGDYFEFRYIGTILMVLDVTTLTDPRSLVVIGLGATRWFT